MVMDIQRHMDIHWLLTHPSKEGAPKEWLRPLHHKICQKLNQDRKEHMEKLGHKIDKHPQKQCYHKAWHLLQPFYCKWLHIFALSDKTLHHIGQEFKELYQKRPPEGDPIHAPWWINILDTIPNKQEITDAMSSLW